MTGWEAECFSGTHPYGFIALARGCPTIETWNNNV
jgi:hypothetical protein